QGFGGAGSVLDEVREQRTVIEVVVTVGGIAVIVDGVAAQIAGLVPGTDRLAVVHVLLAGVLVKDSLSGHVGKVAELGNGSGSGQDRVAGQGLIGSSHGPGIGQAGNAHHILAFGFGFFGDSLQHRSIVLDGLDGAHIDAVGLGHIAVVDDTALPAHLLIGGHAVDRAVDLDCVPHGLGDEVIGLLGVLGQQLGDVHEGILAHKLQIVGGPV